MMTFSALNRILILTLTLTLQASCSDHDNHRNLGQKTHVKLGISRSLFGAPSMVAVGADTFSNYAINVDVHRFQSGKKALEALLAGEVDVATVADMPLVETSFERQDFAVISTFARSGNQVKILALREKIKTPSDLVGKNVGVAFFTTADYYLRSFLKYKLIKESDVTIIDTTSKDLVPRLQARELDAIVTWEPYISNGMQLIGPEHAIEISMTNVARVTFNLVAMKHTIANRPIALQNIIRAYDDAITLLAEKPKFAAELLAKEIEHDVDYVINHLPDYQFFHGIDHSLILLLENQAEWLYKRKHDGDHIPNFLNIIDVTLLSDINPSLVTLIN